MKSITIVLLAMVTVACAGGYHPNYYYNEVHVVNLSGATIRDVDWRIVGTDRSRLCAEVAMHAMCYDRFGRRRYPHQGIDLVWKHPDGGSKAETVNPHVPAYFSTAFPLRIVAEINPDGSVETFYEQDEPDGTILFDD